MSTKDPANLWLMPSLVACASLAVVVAGFLIVRPWEAEPLVPSVNITSSGPAAEPLVREILAQLTTLQAKPGGVQLSASGAAQHNFILYVSADGTSVPQAKLTLMAGHDRSILWSGNFAPESKSSAELERQLTESATKVVDCALDGFAQRKPRIDPPIFGSYLDACASLGEPASAGSGHAIATFEKITATVPQFKAAWAKLLRAELDRYHGLTATEQQAYGRKIRREIDEARRHHHHLLEADAASKAII